MLVGLGHTVLCWGIDPQPVGDQHMVDVCAADGEAAVVICDAADVELLDCAQQHCARFFIDIVVAWLHRHIEVTGNDQVMRRFCRSELSPIL